MDKETVYISPKGNKWRVQYDHHPTAHANTKDEAVEEAYRHVRSSPRGSVGEIKVMEPDGKFQTKWRSDSGGFPSKG